MDNQEPEQLSFSIVDPQMTVESMRDSGYKSTTHALAELVDNSIESGATVIEILGISCRIQTSTLTELAVLDNGIGMDKNTLRGSLRYGHGTRRERKGIGRFGFGLPNSSMSQARRVDVWSWQSGVTNALHTYLSVTDVENGSLEIPEPKRKPIPSVYKDSTFNDFEDSGTLVVWSELDRVEWKRASTTFKHVERTLGRIYRRFLANKSDRLHKDDSRNEEIGEQRTITLIPIWDDGDGYPFVETESVVRIRPDDPLYLMNGTSCPEDFGPGPMFKELEGSPFETRIKYKKQEHVVRIRASYARRHVRISTDEKANWPEQWENQDAGRTSWGKHAAGNMGVSVIRAHREIQLDDSWISGDDPRERWWTIEIDFPTALDEVFGVTNNKQGAMIFQRLAHYDWRREALPGEEEARQVRARMIEDGDHRVHLLDITKQIIDARRVMREKVREARQRRTRDGRDLTEEQKADGKVSDIIKGRRKEGIIGDSDKKGEEASPEEQQEAQVESLVKNHHIDREDALSLIGETIEANNLVRWIQSSQDSPAFFSVESLPNVIQVALNTNHPVYSHIYDVMHPPTDDLSEDEVRARLDIASAAFRILLYSWARYEDEESERNKNRIQKVRYDWGEYAREFFDNDTDDPIDHTDLV